MADPIHFPDPLPITQAVEAMVRSANRDPAHISGVFDAADALIVPVGTTLPPRGQRFVVIFIDRTFLQIDWDLSINRAVDSILARVSKSDKGQP